MSVQDMVAEFHEKFGHPVADKPDLIPDDRANLRRSLIDEELEELYQAQLEGDLVEIADALGDLLYVVYGAALEYGIDLDDVVEEIHRSNMSKLGADGKPVPHPTVPGKIGKGPNYSPPDLGFVLHGQTRWGAKKSARADFEAYIKEANCPGCFPYWEYPEIGPADVWDWADELNVWERYEKAVKDDEVYEADVPRG